MASWNCLTSSPSSFSKKRRPLRQVLLPPYSTPNPTRASLSLDQKRRVEFLRLYPRSTVSIRISFLNRHQWVKLEICTSTNGLAIRISAIAALSNKHSSTCSEHPTSSTLAATTPWSSTATLPMPSLARPPTCPTSTLPTRCSTNPISPSSRTASVVRI